MAVSYYSLKDNSSNVKLDNLTRVGSTKDHYVTVTGVYEDKVQKSTILEISTWGRKRYIDYSEYESYVNDYSNNLFSNILYIYH